MKARYGATPLHLLLHVALFAAFAWIAIVLADARQAANIALWFVGALVLHDLVLLPFYSAIDRVGRRGLRLGRGAVNFVRVPAAVSGVLLLVYAPAIAGWNDASFERVAGTTSDGHLARWLAITAAAFALSAVLYAVSARRAAPAASAS